MGFNSGFKGLISTESNALSEQPQVRSLQIGTLMLQLKIISVLLE